MLSLPELLEDPIYKEFFCTPPRLPKRVKHPTPWRLFVQRKEDHKWASKDFPTYAAAFKAYKKLSKRGIVRDAAINCRSFSFSPPMRTVRVKGKFVIDSSGERVQVTRRIVWEPKLDVADSKDYQWCPYCRRHTAFDFYTSHHALNYLKPSGIIIDPSERRCHICGASERLINPASRERQSRGRGQ